MTTDAFRKALEDIARQKKTTELETEYDLEVADFEGGYDECIDVARAALAAAPQPAPAPADERAKRLQDAMVQDILETPIEEIEAEVREREMADERAAMIEAIEQAAETCPTEVGFSEAIADALRAAGWTRGGLGPDTGRYEESPE